MARALIARIARRLTRHSGIRTRSRRFLLLPLLFSVHLLRLQQLGHLLSIPTHFNVQNAARQLPFRLILQAPWSLHPLFRPPKRD